MTGPDRATDDATLIQPIADALAGRFLVFDGPDGSGKSTQLRRFVDACKSAGVDVCEVREPGGTEVGERIRAVLLEHLDREDMTARCEMLLYMASRAQLCERRIAPAIKRGALVIADRFVSSTLAYQGAAGGLPEEDIHAVAGVATRGVSPDLMVFFDVDQRTAAGRLNPLLDRMESKGEVFHRRVREGYLRQAESAPDRHLLIDASPPPEEVWCELVRRLAERFCPPAPLKPETVEAQGPVGTDAPGSGAPVASAARSA